MENRSGHLWQPIHRFSKNTLLKDLDWAVQAQIRIQVSSHLYSNMRGLLEEGFTLSEFEELSHLLGLSPNLKTHYILNQMALSTDSFKDLYSLEQELWRLFSTNEHGCVVTQALDLLTSKYSAEFSEVIRSHLVAKSNIGGDFKNWMLHDGFKDLVRVQQREISGLKISLSSHTIMQKVTSFFSSLFAKLS